jgi:hypothetical protein
MIEMFLRGEQGWELMGESSDTVQTVEDLQRYKAMNKFE